MRDPDGRLDGRFLDGDDVRGAVHEQQVDDEHRDDGADERRATAHGGTSKLANSFDASLDATTAALTSGPDR